MGCCGSLVLDVPPTFDENELHWSTYDKSAGPFNSVKKEFISKIRQGKQGLSATIKVRTMGDLFQDAIEKCADQPALKWEEPLPAWDDKKNAQIPASAWKSMSYREYGHNCHEVAKAFIELGLKPLDAVNIYGFNSKEWFMAMFGSILSGGIAAGIYPSDTPQQVCFKSKHSGASMAVVQGAKQAKIFGGLVDDLPDLKAIIQWAGTSGDGWSADGVHAGFTRKDGSVVKYIAFESLFSLARKNDTALSAELTIRKKAQQPGSVCSYIYTSGTTGNPKAVMISHDNIIYESCVVLNIMKQYAKIGSEPERVLSYLPLSHVAGMMVDMICPIAIAASFGQPCTVHFARAYDLKRGTIKNRLCSVKPTMFLGVPRVWEKIAEKLKKLVRSQPPPGCVKGKLVSWAKAAGLSYQQSHQLGGSGSTPSCYCVAQKTVQKKVKAGLGLECCKFGFTGAAPISKDTLEFFGQLGLQINEVYGMSECCGATTWSVDQAHVWGSCGWAMPGTEVKIFQPGTKNLVPNAVDIFNATDAEQGEICYRGRHIMTGYMANPDLGADHVKKIEGKLASAVDMDGWLHSGDKGCMGKNGMLKITGRYKELIIGAGGENVAPVPIENMVKKLCPAIANCMMIGEKMPFMAAFITLKAKGATGNEPGSNDLDDEALDVVKGITTISGAAASDEFKKFLVAKVIAANKAAAPSNAACIRKICILPRDFSVATGELTPTLKLKRSVVMKFNKQALDAVYAAPKDQTVVPYVGNTQAAQSSNATATAGDAAPSKTADSAPLPAAGEVETDPTKPLI